MKSDLLPIVLKASTLSERLSGLFVPDIPALPSTKAEERLKRWRMGAAKGEDQGFSRLLSFYKLDLHKAVALLGPVRLNDSNSLPSWASLLGEVLNSSSELISRQIEPSETTYPFEPILNLFIDVARAKLTAEAHADLLCPSALADVEDGLRSELCEISARTFFGVFAEMRAKQHNRAGSYRAFLSGMNDGGLYALFLKYAVLGRLLSIRTQFWIESMSEFLRRLTEDASDIASTFGVSGRVARIRFSTADSHHRGRRVLLLQFESNLKLVYKPRDSEIEKRFSDFVERLNVHLHSLPLRPLRMISKNGYGWFEFVETLPCDRADAAKRFYERAGKLLCLAYVLDATDFRNENLIASADHPVLIDAETLMHYEVPVDREEVPVANRLAGKILAGSVLQTGLLPVWLVSPDASFVFDPSGLGGDGRQRLPYKTLRWDAVNSDEMSLTETNDGFRETHNLPYLDGNALSAADYMEEIVSGFSETYRAFLQLRPQLLKEDGPLAELSAAGVRFILRAGKVYAIISQSLLAPSYLKSGIDRSIQLQLLSRPYITTSRFAKFLPFLQTEVDALEQMDVPLFQMQADSRTMHLQEGMSLDDFFETTGESRVRSRLEQMSAEDQSRQVEFIKAALAVSVASCAHDSATFPTTDEPCEALTPEVSVEIAIELADEIEKRAIRSTDGSVAWIGAQPLLSHGVYQIGCLRPDLYGGSAGLAVFLAGVAKVTGLEKFGELAKCAIRSAIVASCQSMKTRVLPLNGITGVSSTLYAATIVSQLLNEYSIVEDARALVPFISEKTIRNDRSFDVLFGCAGMIFSLVAFHQETRDEEALRKALLCAQHLVNSRTKTAAGPLSWPNGSGVHLTGFASGAAGIACALLSLYRIHPEQSFLQTAQEAILFERAVFDERAGNWPDFRRHGGAIKSFMNAWCHGTTGIAIARIATLDVLDTQEIRSDISAALPKGGMRDLLQTDQCCCGTAASIEALIQFDRVCNADTRNMAFQQAARMVKRSRCEEGFRLLPRFSENVFLPSFFIGTAGIGYELLRLAYPDLLPSVLSLESAH